MIHWREDFSAVLHMLNKEREKLSKSADISDLSEEEVFQVAVLRLAKDKAFKYLVGDLANLLQSYPPELDDAEQMAARRLLIDCFPALDMEWFSNSPLTPINLKANRFQGYGTYRSPFRREDDDG